MKQEMQKEDLIQIILQLTKRTSNWKSNYCRQESGKKFGMSYGVKKIEPIFICKTAGNIYATETFFRVRGGQALPGLCILHEPGRTFGDGRD